MSDEELKEGILGFQSFLSLLYDTIASDSDKYDILLGNENEQDFRIATIGRGYPFFAELIRVLLHLGIHGQLIPDVDRHFIIDSQKLNALKGITKKRMADLLIYLTDLGVNFSGIDVTEPKFNLKNHITFTMHYPDNSAMLIGLKLLSQAQIQVAPKQCYKPETGICSARIETVFLRCDYHPLENIKTKTQKYIIHECINFLSPVMKTYIIELDNLLIQNGCKSNGDIKNFEYSFTYNSIKNKNVVCKIWFGILGCCIKINAECMNEYSDFILKLPHHMIDTIIEGWSCEKKNDLNACNPKCPGGFKFTINGMDYQKCRGINFKFLLEKDVERELIKQWVELELANS